MSSLEIESEIHLTLFQCENCGATLGDSSAIIYICESLGSITIKDSNPSKVIIQDKTEKYNRPELNIVSSVKNVSCIKCTHTVGVVFQKLPAHLASMEGHISLDLSKVSSNLITVDCSQNVMAALMKFQEEISKIKVVLLNINGRLETLENTLAENDSINSLE